jgi:hypothetical protein
MTDIPIIFSAPMVRALLDGRKTMTRRLAWRTVADTSKDLAPGTPLRQEGLRGDDQIMALSGTIEVYRPSPWQKVKPGDRLWVRENFRYTTWDDDCQFRVKYEADGVESKWIEAFDGDDAESLVERICAKLDKKSVPIEDGHYVSTDALGIAPCIHMPRWASRLTLVVTETKVERLHDMSPSDAVAEGMKAISKDGRLFKYGIPDSDGYPGTDDFGWPWEEWRMSPVDAFQHLWVKLHGPESWDANPDVVALSFTVHKTNIDQLRQAAA